MSAWAPTYRQPDRHARISVLLVAAALAGTLMALLVLPVWGLPRDPAWGLLLVPLALASTPLWSLVHEAIHGTLLSDRAWNDRCGRALAVAYGAPFALLKVGHLLHHRYNRTVRERTEIYDPDATSWAAVAPGHYLRLFGGLYLAEMSSVALAIAPTAVWRHLGRRLDAPQSVAGMVVDRLGRPVPRRQFRADAGAVVVVYLGAVYAYGRYAWMLAAALGVRAVLVSMADNAYHYGTKLEAPLEAMNLRLPRPVETIMLGFNLHSVHHRHPGLRWYELRAAFTAEQDTFHLDWLTAVLRQLRGPIPATAVSVRPAVGSSVRTESAPTAAGSGSPSPGTPRSRASSPQYASTGRPAPDR